MLQARRRCAAPPSSAPPNSPPPTVSVHTLRHTVATNLLRSGVDIVVLAQVMGHRRLDTTRRYTLPTHADLERAVAKLPTDQ